MIFFKDLYNSQLHESRKAFTLAEILITLAIIGVVAAMIIPPLMNKIQDAQLKTAWKKSYAILTEAMLFLKNENGGTIQGVCPDFDTLCGYNLFKTKLIVAKSYPLNTLVGSTWANSLKTLNGSSPTWLTNTGLSAWKERSFILNDGSLAIPILNKATSCNATYSLNGNSCGLFILDVNGFKPPNTQGKDIIFMAIQKTSVMPLGADGGWPGYDWACDPSLNHIYNGMTCLAKYRKEDL